MAKKHSIEEILTRLRRYVSEGKAIMGAGAGTGISAKFAPALSSRSRNQERNWKHGRST